MKQQKKSLITVLLYHRVNDNLRDTITVCTDTFQKQMEYLKKNYNVISVRELLNRMKEGRNSDRAVVITFDDCYRDNYENAVPILQMYQLPACFFISSSMVGTEKAFKHDLEIIGHGLPNLKCEDIVEMDKNDFEIGSHTISHPRLSECNEETLCKEIFNSKKQLEEMIGKEILYFSFPHGKQSDFSEYARDVVKKAKYECNFSAYGGLNSPRDNVFDIKRIGIPESPSLTFFKAWIEGWKIT